jgi:hypothetical protein
MCRVAESLTDLIMAVLSFGYIHRFMDTGIMLFL